MLLPYIWAPSSLQYTSVQDASVLTAGLHPHCQIPQTRMLLPSSLGFILADKYLSSGCFCPHCWAPSSLPNTSVQDASVLTAGLHPHCQLPQFRMLVPSLLGSILTFEYLSSGCFCPHCWALSSLLDTSVQDASALHLGSILPAKYLSSGCFCPPSVLHPHCQIPQFRMRLPSIWAPSSLTNTTVQDASALTARLHPHCRIPQFRMRLASVWASSSLTNTTVQDASALSQGSVLTAEYLSSGCFCPPSGLRPHCQIPQFSMLLPSI